MILDKIIELALLEDLSLGDITSDTIFTPENRAKAVIRAKEDLVLCGMETAREVFAAVDPQVRFTPLKKDGDDVKTELEIKVYRVIKEAFETFFPAFGKGLQST